MFVGTLSPVYVHPHGRTRRLFVGSHLSGAREVREAHSDSATPIGYRPAKKIATRIPATTCGGLLRDFKNVSKESITAETARRVENSYFFLHFILLIHAGK